MPKTERFNFRISPQERAKLAELAKMEHKTQAETLRALICTTWEVVTQAAGIQTQPEADR